MRGLAVAAALSLSFTPACSWLFMPHVAEERATDELPDCSEDMTAPLIDVVSSVVDAAQAAAVLASDADANVKVASVLVGGVAAVVYGFSAHSGFTWAQGCRVATSQWIVDRTDVATRDQIARAEATRLADHPASSWSCASASADPTRATCAKVLADCDAAARELARTSPDVGACTPTPVVVCFRTLGLDGVKAEHCLPTMSACVASHDHAIAQPDQYQRVSACSSSAASE